LDSPRVQKVPNPTHELAAWFQSRSAQPSPVVSEHRKTAGTVHAHEWKSELAELQDRLINNSLAATVEEEAIKANSAELKVEAARLAEELDVMGMGHVDNERRKTLAIFDWSERAAETLGSNTADRRKMLIAVQSNRQMSDVTQATTRRKPFDLLAERLH
jgi:hypothetical protein